jgi:PhnB protein
METLNIPEGYQQVMPYLIIKNAPAFFEFMQKVFGATERYKAMRDETLIMHAEISIGDSVIMFADATEQYPERPAGMFVYVRDCDAAYKTAIENGATSVAEPADQSYGRSAGVCDPFGNTWWLTSVAGKKNAEVGRSIAEL